MPFVAAVCTQCGATIKVDNNKESGICPNCNTRYITKKVINNHNTYVNNTYIVDDEEMKNTKIKNIDELIKDCEKAIKVIDYEILLDRAYSLIENYQFSYFGYKYLLISLLNLDNYEKDFYRDISSPNSRIYSMNSLISSIQYGSKYRINITLSEAYNKMDDRMTPEDKIEEEKFLLETKEKIITFNNRIKDRLSAVRKGWLIGLIASALILVFLIFIVIQFRDEDFSIAVFSSITLPFISLALCIAYFILYNKRYKKFKSEQENFIKENI